MCRWIEFWLFFQANQTFSDFARGIQLSKDWEGYIESVQKHFAGSSTYDILRVSEDIGIQEKEEAVPSCGIPSLDPLM